MIQINEKKDCCGCTACKNICPVNAITMKKDNEGFLYPEIDLEKCVKCGLCEKTCPILNKREKNENKQEAYVINNKNNKIRSESTSGGAFTPIAEYVIKNDGVVFGATYGKNLEVYHMYTEKIEDLYLFRGSKYVQSDLKDSFQEVKKFLLDDRLVLFSGTPCQIQGLKSFLGKEYNNLITLDVVCRAVPSPLVLEKYLNYQKKKNNVQEINSIIFRDKSKYGYSYSSMTVEGKDFIYREGVETDPYLRAFFNNYSGRPSCYDCKFRNKERISDFTVWDCFTISEFDKRLADNKGTTRMIIQTKKGKEIFEKIKDNYNYTEINVEDAVKNVRELLESPKPNQRREKFFNDLNEMNEEDFFEKYFPNTIKVRVEKIIRKILIKTKLNDIVKNLVKKLIKKG